ncbi:ComEA family DNA-binding protein [Eremococcus coleocola]|uniref:ComEA family DNA-binding protein n=1 Tax=Eremococcus coleocola TaxID=88132 RepID=UPI0003FADA44|nr:ComEA family DNA-binding protein [Eremococcus coleocola]
MSHLITRFQSLSKPFKMGLLGFVIVFLGFNGFITLKSSPGLQITDLSGQESGGSLEEVSMSNFESAGNYQAEHASGQENQQIYVDIKGQIKLPGVYQLESGSRLFDLIDQAGGLTPQAAQEQINQAQVLSDQMLVYIPSHEEVVRLEEGSDQTLANLSDTELAGNQVHAGMNPPDTASSLININTADVNLLQTLPNIGPKKAEAIINYRQEIGSFQSVEELIQVPGIGKKTLEGLIDLICI